MRRPLWRWFAPVLLALCGFLPAVSADDFKDLHPNAGAGLTGPAAAPTPAESGEKAEKPPPTLAYLAAVMAAVVVLCIICVPSRKAESSTSR